MPVNPNDCTLDGSCAPASAINIAGFPTTEVDNMGYHFWLALVVLVMLSGLFVAARIATRWQMKQMGLDDFLIIAAMVSSPLIHPPSRLTFPRSRYSFRRPSGALQSGMDTALITCESTNGIARCS